MSWTWPEVNKTHRVYQINRTVGFYYKSFGTPMTCEILERDTVGSDDSLGKVQIRWDDPYGPHDVRGGWFGLAPE